jgi:hypothetical protein
VLAVAGHGHVADDGGPFARPGDDVVEAIRPSGRSDDVRAAVDGTAGEGPADAG